MHTTEPLESYMQSEYLLDKREIERVEGVIDTVVPVFERFFIADGDAAKWPYKVIDRRRPNAKEEAEWEIKAPYSKSTNAMILFTLFVVSGRVRSHMLIPKVRPLSPKGYSEPFESKLHTAFKTLMKKIAEANFEIHSPTFGDNDPFTLTWILEIAHSLQMSSEQGIHDENKKIELRTLIDRLTPTAVQRVRDAANSPAGRLLHFRKQETPGQRKTLWEAPEHVFPLLRIVHLYKLLKEMGKMEEPLDFTPIHRYFTDHLHSHLSYSSIPNSNFDAAELAFSLEGALICDPDARNEDVLKRTFQVIADRQAQNPYWRPMRPFVATPQGLVLLPLSVEIANSLLRICSLVDGADLPESYFSSYVQMFRQYAAWVHSRLLQGEAFPRPGADVAEPFVGWHSEHLDVPGTIHLWETSQVLLFLVHYAAMLQQHIARSALYRANFSGKPANRSGTEKGYWDRIKKKYEFVKGFLESSDYCIYHRIGEDYVAPRAPEAAKESTPREPHYSMLLYGPPGTGKTTLATQLAKALGYRFIEITPSDFIARGEAEVEARAKAIFQTLREQSNVVILFDEIDRMILDRDSKLYQLQSDIFQFMTPGMLTKIKDLHDREEPIFAIATNYFERIDAAAKRSGRIDDLYLILPPDKIKRYEILKESIDKYTGRKKHADPDQISEEQVKAALDETVNNTPLFTFKELDQLVRNALKERGIMNGPNWLLELGKELAQQTKDIKPTITLASYRSRFRALSGTPEEFPTAQEPFEEFLLLVKLVLEAKDDLPSEEKEHLKKVILEARHSVPRQSLLEGILKNVRDESVRRFLLDKFEHWGWCL